MVKSTHDKKLILGSALAGLLLAPALSVTATSTGGKLFQTVQLSSGYRLAHAEEKKAVATPAPAPTPAPASTKTLSDQPTTKGDPMPKKSGGEMKCGAGSCG